MTPPNIMGPDGLIIFLFILLFFGARELPGMAKGLGERMRDSLPEWGQTEFRAELIFGLILLVFLVASSLHSASTWR